MSHESSPESSKHSMGEESRMCPPLGEPAARPWGVRSSLLDRRTNHNKLSLVGTTARFTRLTPFARPTAGRFPQRGNKSMRRRVDHRECLVAREGLNSLSLSEPDTPFPEERASSEGRVQEGTTQLWVEPEHRRGNLPPGVRNLRRDNHRSDRLLRAGISGGCLPRTALCNRQPPVVPSPALPFKW